MTLPNTNVTLDTPKKKGIALGVLALALLVGFAFGKFNNKPNVSISEKQQTASQQTVQDTSKDVDHSQDKSTVVASKTDNRNVTKDTDTVTTTTVDKKPTGEEVTQTTTETKTHVTNNDQTKQGVQATAQQTSTDQKSNQEAVKSASQSKTDFQETITQSQPKWMLGAFGGFDTSGFGLNGNALVTGPLLYGVEGGYRFLGPLWVDAKVMKTGAGFAAAAGLQLQF
jgi:hypothetical protein